MSGTLISVIVPCYNQSQYIEDTLHSILSQRYSNWECIVVNDGSTDNSKEKIEIFAQKDPRFKLVNTRNSGVIAARNTGVAQASGVYIFPLDGDDRIHEDCLQKCLAEFERNPDLKLVCPQGQLFGAEEGLWVLPDFDYKTMLHHNMVHNSSLFLKKDFDRVGGYRTNMVYGLEDWDLFIALLYGARKDQVVKLQEPLFYYRVNQSGRRLTVEASGRQSEMMDLIVYNNFPVYREYFPDIFTRIHEYEFHKTMLNKKPVKLLVNTLMRISTLKNKFSGKKK